MTDPGPGRSREDEPLMATSIATALAEVMSSLDAEILKRLMALVQLRHVRAGTTVLDEYEPPQALGFVLSGMLGMVKKLSDGRTHLIGLLVPRNSFGRIFDGPSSFRSEALADATLLMLERDGLETCCARILTSSNGCLSIFWTSWMPRGSGCF